MAIEKKYIDLDLSLGMTGKGDVRKKVNMDAINQHLKLLILTEQDDVPFLNNISADVRSLLFQPFSPFMADTLSQVIENIVTQFEKRIIVNKVEVSMDRNDLQTTISYTIKQTRVVGVFKTILKRVR